MTMGSNQAMNAIFFVAVGQCNFLWSVRWGGWSRSMGQLTHRAAAADIYRTGVNLQLYMHVSFWRDKYKKKADVEESQRYLSK